MILRHVLDHSEVVEKKFFSRDFMASFGPWSKTGRIHIFFSEKHVNKLVGKKSSLRYFSHDIASSFGPLLDWSQYHIFLKKYPIDVSFNKHIYPIIQLQ